METLQNMMGLYEKALAVREAKFSIISSNIANADTPMYLAKDIDFRKYMKTGPNFVEKNLPLVRTHPSHFYAFESKKNYPEQYRVPISASIDDNTVDQNYEKMAFMNNAVRYSSTIAFIKVKKAMVMQVIQGD